MTKQERKFWDSFINNLSKEMDKDASINLLDKMYKKYTSELSKTNNYFDYKIQHHQDASDLLKDFEHEVFSTSNTYKLLYKTVTSENLPFELTDDSLFELLIAKEDELRNMLESYISIKENKPFNKLGIWNKLMAAEVI